MKKGIKYFSLLLILLLVFKLNAQERCGFDQIYKQLSENTSFKAYQSQMNLQNRSLPKNKSQTIIVIPTVVHVIYKNQDENVSSAQIQSQLDILNDDFRKLNADTTNVEQGFSIADVGIEFCLARRDPSGNETTGVTRTSTTIDNVCDLSSTQYYQLAPIWNPDHYLNIWVCDINNGIAGYAFPPNQIARNRDGLVIQYNNFGDTGTVNSPYDQGRTATHEIGHWFNLFHPWGNGNIPSCGSDDEVIDTPNQGVIYNGCPSVPQFSCGSKDMLSNYMGYLDDRCMGNFTEGQKDRMRSTIITSRPDLLLSKGCLPVGLAENTLANTVRVFPNPISNQFNIQLLIGAPQVESIELLNSSGKMVFRETKSIVNGYQFELEKLPDGLYFLRLKSNEAQVIKKLIIAH